MKILIILHSNFFYVISFFLQIFWAPLFILTMKCCFVKRKLLLIEGRLVDRLHNLKLTSFDIRKEIGELAGISD